jgi:hypothetical protein
MGVAKKNRRTIVVNERNYFWYIAEDVENFPVEVMPNLYALNVISEDKKFVVRYHLGQKDPSTRHLIVIGEEFVGQDCRGPCRRFRCPRWGSENRVTPKHVRAAIEWCLAENKEIVEVDYRGRPIDNSGGRQNSPLNGSGTH